MGGPKKQTRSAGWDISESAGSTTGNSRRAILDMRFERIHQRREALREKRKVLEYKAWTDPGSNLKEEWAALQRQRDELDREVDALVAAFEANISANDEVIASMRENIRDIWRREYDLQKHVTTLSTGSILGLGAIVSLFAPGPGFGSAAAPSLISFLLAIILAMLAMALSNVEIFWIVAMDGSEEIEPSGRLPRFLRGASRSMPHLLSLGSLLAFCTGAFLIVVFVLRYN